MIVASMFEKINDAFKHVTTCTVERIGGSLEKSCTCTTNSRKVRTVMKTRGHMIFWLSGKVWKFVSFHFAEFFFFEEENLLTFISVDIIYKQNVREPGKLTSVVFNARYIPT